MPSFNQQKIVATSKPYRAEVTALDNDIKNLEARTVNRSQLSPADLEVKKMELEKSKMEHEQLVMEAEQKVATEKINKMFDQTSP